jgi:hypothetical protein
MPLDDVVNGIVAVLLSGVSDVFTRQDGHVNDPVRELAGTAAERP